MKVALLLSLFLTVFALVQLSNGTALSPTDLLVEYLASPVLIGIDTPKPRFSFTLSVTDPTNNDRGITQDSYQILVSSDMAGNNLVWDSGRVYTEQTSLIRFGGTGTVTSPLESSSTYYWRVRWWPNRTQPGSNYSEVASFNTGFLKGQSEWTAQWIGGFNQLRKEFTAPKAIVKARAYILGLGYYELFVNGQRISDHVLDPAWTHYAYRSEYVSYDVLPFLTTTANSPNCIGVWLGNGWYGQGWNGPLSLLFQLEVFHADGTKTVVISDLSWKGSQGPIIYDSIYNGEHYDARLEQEGWNTINFVDSSWSAARSVSPPWPTNTPGKIVAQMLPPVKRMVTGLNPKKVTNPQAGIYVYDFEQNMSGWAKITIPGEISKTAGVNITLKFAEILMFDKSGMIYTANLRTAQATDTYITKGNPAGEVYEPHFTYHGFQFMQLTITGGTNNYSPLALNQIEGIHVYSSVKTIGQLQFDNPTITRTARNIWWGQSSNLMSVPTDCDQRDERLGWMADGQLSVEEAIHNFDMPAFYTNWVRLIGDEVGSDGSVTDTTPFVRYGQRPADPAWGAAYPLTTYWLWKYYNDTDIVVEQWDGLIAYMKFLQNRANSGGIGKMYGYYGDWVPPPPAQKASVSFTSGWYVILNFLQMAELAQKVMNSPTVASQFTSIAQGYISDFNKFWFNPSTNIYDFGVQTDLSLPLYLGVNTMVSQQSWAAVSNNLVNNIVNSCDTKLSTGILGTKYLMLVLSQIGRTDLALALSTTTGYPGWAWEFANQTYEVPATTVWELWDAPLEGPGMNSRNHIMYGSWSDWAFKWLVGIQQEEGTVGYKQVVIDGFNLGGKALNSASGRINGWPGMGELKANWTVNGSAGNLGVILPVGSSGKVKVKTVSGVGSVVIKEGSSVVWQGGKFVSGVSGVTGAVANGGNEVVFTVGSGEYMFSQ